MNEFELVTSSTCDLPSHICDKFGIKVVPMDFTLDNVPYQHYLDARELSYSDFYKSLKNGAVARTTLINIQAFLSFFEPILESGRDILFIAFSTGLSGSHHNAKLAMEMLGEKYPGRTMISIDSLCASAGEGYLVYLAALQKESGMQINQLAEYCENIKLNICHWFVVDDLDQLVRGGRINAFTAVIGKSLQIKPLISLDFNGKLTTVAKVRGTAKVYEALVSRFRRDSGAYKRQTAFIAHSDNYDGALAFAEKLKEETDIKDYVITDVGPIIGTHTGTGMLALVFLGNRCFE